MPADISQIRALSRDLRNLGPASRKQARLAVRKVVAATEHDAKLLAPVDTGLLRSSISGTTVNTPDGAIGEVGPTANYGLFVELGTSRMPGQPYLGPAFDRNQIPFRQALLGLGELP